MNEAYSQDDARLWLNAYMAGMVQRYQDEDDAIPLQLLSVETVAVEAFTGPDTHRLTRVIKGEPEEVVVRIAGILCQKNLPPFLGTAPTEMKHVRKLRQFVKLTAFTSPLFDDLDSKIGQVHDTFMRKVTDGAIEPCKSKRHEGHFSIDLHCRYFTDRRDAPEVQHNPFGRGVDPLHRLDDARGDIFIHGDENIVQYGRLVTDDTGCTRIEHMNPGLFEVGDIVEASVSFVCYPIYQGGYVIRPTLRALVLATAHIREEAKARRAKEMNGVQIVGGQKRGLGTQGPAARPNKRRFMDLP